MANIHNSDLFKELKEGIKSQGFDIPNQLAEKVVPVMEVNPKLLRRIVPFPIAADLSNQTVATAYTTSTTMDTYLSGFTFSYNKDATSTATTLGLYATPEESNLSTALIRVKCFTLTAQNGTISVCLPQPIKLKKGSNITYSSDTNVANISISCSLFGYQLQNSSA